MTKVLILGAGGQIARVATRLFLERGDVSLTLYLRNARRLDVLRDQAVVVDGDVLDTAGLATVMAGQDVVYAHLDGRLEEQAPAVVKAMGDAGVRRLIWISSMGIYDEVPGDRAGSILDPYRKSAAVIETSALDYTIIRPAWLNDRDDVSYGTTSRTEPFKNGGATVSRKSVADLVVRLATTPGEGVRQSLGVHST